MVDTIERVDARALAVEGKTDIAWEIIQLSQGTLNPVTNPMVARVSHRKIAILGGFMNNVV